jgi:hypothetical protein
MRWESFSLEVILMTCASVNATEATRSNVREVASCLTVWSRIGFRIYSTAPGSETVNMLNHFET